jgi:alkylated DNA repair dioxygenase AlkB
MSSETARLELSEGCVLEYEPVWLAPADASVFERALRHDLAWEQREIVLFGRNILQPRLIAWGGDVPYRYSGQTLEPRAMTPALRRLLQLVGERAHTAFNHVLVNRYRDGRDSMGMHSDDEPELGDNPVVATVSFGERRRFVVAPKQKRSGSPVSLDLEHGSIVVMSGGLQHSFRHGIPKKPQARGERISATFRNVLRVI